MSVNNEINSYDVHAYREGDETQIVEVLKLSLPEWTVVKNPVNYWRWKYKSNPNGFECFTISLNDKIIGTSHTINIKIKIGDEVVNAHCPTDDAVHPDYRGKGIYNKLYSGKEPLESKKTVVDVWSARNPIIIDKAAASGNYPLPFKIKKMMRIKNIKKHIDGNPTNSPWSYPVLSYLKSLNSLNGLSKPRKTDDVNVFRIEGFNSDIDAFCDQLLDYYKLTIIRDQPYLNWRYCNPEAEETIVLQALKNEAITGFCAAEIKETANRRNEAYILDFLCLPSDRSTPYYLMEALLNELDEKYVNEVHFRVTDMHPYRLVAEKYGFIDMTRWSTMKYFIHEEVGHEYFKKNVDEISSFPEDHVYLSHGDIL